MSIDNNKIDSAELSAMRDAFMVVSGREPEVVTRLAGAGSNRRYFRLSDGEGVSLIAVEGAPLREARDFVELDGVFREAGINVPKVVFADLPLYLQEDLGDRSLFDCIADDRKRLPDGELSEETIGLLEKTMRSLAGIQAVAVDRWLPCVGGRKLTRRQVMWDLNYFKYEMAMPAGVEFDANALEDDFEALADRIMALCSRPDLSGFMYRDCQSRNVMIKDGVPWWIDFQGGMYGPSLYDAVSFLWQAKARFPQELRARLLDVWMRESAELRGIRNPELLLAGLDEMILFRMLQVLGAYGFRGLVERKAHFIESIPPALATLAELVAGGKLDSFTELRRVAEGLLSSPRFADLPGVGKCSAGLRVKVFSFSYKKGYPEDLSGNGGGFMFDCRGMHNPGRYDEYKSLTGLDEPVRAFLRERGEADRFVEMALDIVSPSVSTYLRRGFSNLQIGFGCTGGQHRSVYCAQAVGERLRKEFPEANVEIIHREQEGGRG